jgi:hypothetical protein
MGTLEQRGRSLRVIHYEWKDGKRIFTKHKLGANGNNMGTRMGTEKTEKCLFNENKELVAPPKGFEPLTDWLTASRSTGLSHGGTLRR